MDIIFTIVQVVIAITIFNVWLIRFNKSTPWRAGSAKNMQEEFQTYGLPIWFMRLISVSKLLLAALLIAGIWYNPLIKPAATGMLLLMLGAVLMHFKVKDPVKKSLPAASLMILSISLLAV
jgi:hypothetical protein